MKNIKITQSITNRQDASLGMYFRDVSKQSLIDSKEEIKLAERIKKGDQKAIDKLVKANLRFVISVAKQYQNKGLSLVDLIQEGNIGLIEGAKRYDETKGFKFISYAVWWIRQSIQECLTKRSKVITNEVSENENIKVIVNDDGETNEETFEYCHETTSEYDDIMNELNDSKCFIINKLMKKLPLRGRKIISFYYGLNGEEEKNLEEIGDELGITKERVRQIKEQCLKILRTELLMSENYEDLFIS